jgi:osmoprotectant transport system ATP-binding protein
VSRMTGIADRAMRLLSLTTAGEAAVPGSADGPAIPASASLRDALSELVWRGVESAPVMQRDGTSCGRLTVATILARGRPG